MNNQGKNKKNGKLQIFQNFLMLLEENEFKIIKKVIPNHLEKIEQKIDTKTREKLAERQARVALAPYEYQNQLRQQAQNSSAGYNSMISSSTGAINPTNNSVSTTTNNNSGRPANFVTLGSAGNYSSNNTGSLSSNINGLAMANLRNTGGVQSSSTSASYPSGR